MPVRSNKATMHELKLRRLLEHNIRLREECARPRIPVSAAAGSLIDFTRNNKDPLLPSVWGPVQKGEDPYAPVSDGGCCSLM